MMASKTAMKQRWRLKAFWFSCSDFPLFIQKPLPAGHKPKQVPLFKPFRILHFTPRLKDPIRYPNPWPCWLLPLWIFLTPACYFSPVKVLCKLSLLGNFPYIFVTWSFHDFIIVFTVIYTFRVLSLLYVIIHGAPAPHYPPSKKRQPTGHPR